MPCPSEIPLRVNCTMNIAGILLSFEREQLKSELNFLLENKKRFVYWYNFPFISNLHESHFWEILKLSWKAEQHNVKYMKFPDNRAILFIDDNVPLLHFMGVVSKKWVPAAVKRGTLSRILLPRKIASYLLNQDPNSVQCYRYLYRIYLINKYNINIKYNASPFEQKKQIEKDIGIAYNTQMKTVEKFSHVNLEWKTIQKSFPTLLTNAKNSVEFKTWKKKMNIKHLHLTVKDTFLQKTLAAYPFSIPMFEKMYDDLKNETDIAKKKQ